MSILLFLIPFETAVQCLNRTRIRHVYPLPSLSRAQLIALLYEHLPDKTTRIKTGAAVADIKTHENGIKVYLRDGRVE